MVQLQFDVCIFAGLVCRECGVALDSMEMRAFKLKRHLEEQHDNMELDHQHEFKRLSALMEKCASSLFGFATDVEIATPGHCRGQKMASGATPGHWST